MLLLNCPNCGQRNVNEFHYGGEVKSRPQQSPSPTDRQWADYLYMQQNPLGWLREWWCHRGGCGEWFVAERHTKTHEVRKTCFHH